MHIPIFSKHESEPKPEAQSTVPPESQKETTPDLHQVALIPVRSIVTNPYQPRSPIERESLTELASSIREHGILQPLVVRPRGEQYELIAGERRFQAARLLGLTAVPAIVREVTEQQQLELALIENLQREDLNPLEEAASYRQLMERFQLTQEQVAQRVGKSRSYIANTMRLQGLPQEAKEALLGKRITEGHAKVLLSLESREERLRALEVMLRDKLTVRASEAILQNQRRKRTKVADTPPVTDPELMSNSETLQQALGTKVSIQKTGDHGKIVIEFYSQEELRNLLEQITKHAPQ